MGNRTEYIPGQEIGGNGFIFLEEVEPKKYKKDGSLIERPRRRAKFLCPVCKQETEMDITPVSCGRTKMCLKCADKIRNQNNTETFKPGQSIGDNGIIFLEELGWHKGHRKIKALCPICKQPFEVFLDNVKRNHTKYCLDCSRKQAASRTLSKGAERIKNVLQELNISYDIEHTFPGCYGASGKKLLPFDFYLPDFKVCIEFDGLQHSKAIDFFGGQKTLSRTKYHDFLKNLYCESNNIGIIRISYSEEENVSPEKLYYFIQQAQGGHFLMYNDFVYSCLKRFEIVESNETPDTDDLLTYEEAYHDENVREYFLKY